MPAVESERLDVDKIDRWQRRLQRGCAWGSKSARCQLNLQVVQKAIGSQRENVWMECWRFGSFRTGTTEWSFVGDDIAVGTLKNAVPIRGLRSLGSCRLLKDDGLLCPSCANGNGFGGVVCVTAAGIACNAPSGFPNDLV